jgi:LuxR family maltose regulon positive regulatory protein
VGHVHDVDPLGGEPDQEPARGVLAPLALAIARHRVGADDAWVHLGAALEHAEPWGLIGPFAELPAALTITLGARPTHTPFAAAARAAAQREVPSATPGLQLTSTELTVLAALANPLPLREVADQLFVSTNTLKTHLRRIYRKLGVTSRSEAVAVARRLGLT